MTPIFCGVDVSSLWLDASLGPDGSHRRFRRTADGIAELAAFCRQHDVALVALEATGGYETLPFTMLWAHDVPCALVDPRAVRRFAQGMGILEKTDRIDAAVLVQFARAKALKPQPPASSTQARLRALAARLRQTTELIVSQRNQRRLVEDPTVLASIDALLRLLQRQAKDLDREIVGLIGTDPLWSALETAFRSIKGVAGRTVGRMLADLPEIGTLNGKAIAKLVGLAPIANESGTIRKRRSIRGGRESVRSILTLVAIVVAKHNSDFAAFRAKLLAAGKPKMVVRIALARKLLVRLNAKARDTRAQLA